jgi:hypothetical protein
MLLFVKENLLYKMGLEFRDLEFTRGFYLP